MGKFVPALSRCSVMGVAVCFLPPRASPPREIVFNSICAIDTTRKKWTDVGRSSRRRASRIPELRCVSQTTIAELFVNTRAISAGRPNQAFTYPRRIPIPRLRPRSRKAGPSLLLGAREPFSRRGEGNAAAQRAPGAAAGVSLGCRQSFRWDSFPESLEHCAKALLHVFAIARIERSLLAPALDHRGLS